jgi:cytochrome b6-f complex iron-sulfur subunit
LKRELRLSRRSFIGGSAATLCVGCAGGPALPGVEVDAGSVDEVNEAITAAGGVYVADALAWLVAVPSAMRATALDAYATALHPGIEAGFLALYQRCPHQGCRVALCPSSGWFECPCHAALFGPTGEHREGVPSRGMDHFPVAVRGGRVSIDASAVVRGLPRGSLVDDRGPVGAHCVR